MSVSSFKPRLRAAAMLAALAVPGSSVLLVAALPGQALAQPAAQAPATPAAIPRELGKPEDEIKLDVKGFRVDGLSGADAAKLATALPALTASYTGAGRSYEDLVGAVDAVTRYLQSELGYYVGFAYLPEQAWPTDGIVRIYALEGRLDEVRLNWPEALPVRRDVAEAYLKELQPGSVLREKEVERAALLVGDLQGVRTRFEIEPGRQPGTAALIITAEPDQRVAGSGTLDTLGTRYTGVGRGSAQVAVRSPTGSGDVLTVNALGSFTGGLALGGASYVLPIGGQGLKLGTAISKVRYRLDDDLFTDELDGTATAASLFGLYPAVRSRNLNVFGLASYEHKRFSDDLNDSSTSKNSNDFTLGVLGDARDSLLGGGINTFQANWLQGRMDFDAADAGTTGLPSSFGKLLLGYSRLQSILPGRVMAYGRYRGQLANDNLDVTERLALGGPDAVRAYSPGEAAADTAHLLSAELRFLPPGSWLGQTGREWAFSLFYDWGHGQFRHDEDALPATGLKNTTTLSGWGLGAVWERPGNFALRLDLAWRGIGAESAQPLVNRQEPRANAVLTKSF